MRLIGWLLLATAIAGPAAGETVRYDARSVPSKPSDGYLKLGTAVSPSGGRLGVNSRYLTLDGKSWLPVMGEMHFARIPHERWDTELAKVKASGVDIVATYMFWNYHQETPERFDFSGDRDVRRFLMLAQRVSGPLMQMAQLINQFDEARSAVTTVRNLVNQPPEEGRSGHGVRSPIDGTVEFSNVTFKYKGAVSPSLNRVSFEISRGTTLGVMGKSGSGKTTITRLLQRLHSDYEGLIKIDGIDVREYDVDHLRRNVSIVLQENFLFSGTIRDNICAAKPDATFDDIVKAARMAGAEEFIDKLPRGYETYVYEGSPNLSGGQRQRLAIARALIVNPPILILDEATSALDADSEAIVNGNISRIANGRTLIIISHRLSSLTSADAILVLDGGVVDDIGRHQELLERNDIYSSLWYQQNTHLAPAVRSDKPNFRSPTLVS